MGAPGGHGLGALEQVRRQLRELAALTADQGDVARQWLPLEALDEPGQAVALGIHVGVIDLIRICLLYTSDAADE